MIIEKLEIEKGVYIENVDTVEMRDYLLKMGIDIDVVEQHEMQRLALASLKTSIQKKLDKTAQSYGYDNMQSARAWRNTPNYSQNELVEKLAEWAGSCWDKAREIQGKVLKGERSFPTEEELMTELPKFEE